MAGLDAPCRRPGCHRKADSASHLLCQTHAYATGAILPRVPARETQQRIRALFDQGWSSHAIGCAAGVSHTTALAVLSQDSIRQETAAAILSVPVGPPPVRGHHPEPIRRRLQALRAAGWTLQELAEHTGLGATAICAMTSDDYAYRIPDAKAEAVLSVYERLSVQGIIRPAGTRVQARGWVPPMVWTDIDDLDETHDLAPGQVWAAGAVMAQIRQLLDVHGSLARAAQACGLAESSLRNWLIGNRDYLSLTSARAIYRATRDLRKDAA